MRRDREEAALVWTWLEFAAMVALGGMGMGENCEVSKVGLRYPQLGEEREGDEGK